MTLQPANYLDYLSKKGKTEETATESMKSAARAYASTYDWYINNQNVTPENAEIASDVFINKYALRNENDIVLEMTPEDMWRRLANSLAKTEVETNKVSTKTEQEWADEFYEAFKDFKYVLGGSGLAAVGNKYVNSSASNCFVVDGATYGDSIEGIFETASKMARIYSYRGGVGIDLSHLRPANAKVSNAAKTSTGAASFMDFYSQVTGMIGQQGRRGALMASIRVDHPDVFKFINEKRDLDKQWFITELEDAGIDLNDWKYSSIAARLKSTTNANVSVRLTDAFIKAVEDDTDFELWYDFPSDSRYAPIRNTVRARDIWDALIAGATKAAEPGIFNWEHLLRESVTDCYAGNKEYQFTHGNTGYKFQYDTRTITTNPCLAADTLIQTVSGPMRIADLANMGDVLVYCVDSANKLHLRPMRQTHKTQQNAEVYRVTFNTGDTLVCTGNHRLQLHGGIQVMVQDIKTGDLGLPVPKYDELVAETITAVALPNAGFGEVARKCEVCGEVYYVKHDARTFAYCSRKCADAAMESKKARYAENLKAGAVYPAHPSVMVTKVERLEAREDVYNGTVDEHHTYCIYLPVGNTNVATPQCGELPLSHGDSCCLGSLYLMPFVDSPWTANAAFNFDKFAKYARLGIRIQDNVKEQDIDKVPLEVNKQAALLMRRIGIGCHGLGDALAALGFKYDSPEAIEMASTIYEALKNTIYDESVDLGLEKGVAPIWDWELEKDNPFLSRLDPAVLERIKTCGRRNIAMMTNAPTGSLSILSRNCSSGIEPVFMVSYDRAVRRQGSTESDVHTIYHQAVKDCKDVGGDINVFVTAGQIDGYRRVEMQAAIQKHVDHSISSTVNLPAGTTEDYVSQLYLYAFKSGCKGLTVYVDGSRGGVLVDSNKKPKTAPGPMARPKTVDVDIHHVSYKGQKYAVLVGKMPDGTPVECFAGAMGDFTLPTKYHSATLTKDSRKNYNLHVQFSEDADDYLRIKDTASKITLAGEDITVTRLISLLLRNRVSVNDIVSQLSATSRSMFDLSSVLSRVLKKYVPEDIAIAAAKKEPCTICGGEYEVKYEAGCVTKICKQCGNVDSKCG